MGKMRNDQYRFRFYFNANHAIYLSGKKGEVHSHTWEIVLNVMKVNDSFVMFNEIERMCDSFLSQFQDVVINDIPPFTTVNPTLENLCAYFKDEMQRRLHEKEWLLLSIELSETPARSYIISTFNESFGETVDFDKEKEETLQEILTRVADKKADSIGKKESIKPKAEEGYKEEIISKEVNLIKKAIKKNKPGLFNRSKR
jgi:6-pyruvoyltetrahydropterin/6-carboxytetrahydropterin synthase